MTKTTILCLLTSAMLFSCNSGGNKHENADSAGSSVGADTMIQDSLNSNRSDTVNVYDRGDSSSSQH